MCGHDGHMACLTGAILLLSQVTDRIPQNLGVRFMFQPSEETGEGGALPMIQEGCLEGVHEVYVFHYQSPGEFGKLYSKPGPILSHYAGFKITVIGKGGHGGKPESTVDPIIVGSNLVVALQSIISRSLPPGHPAVISVCKFHSGEAENVIPGHPAVISVCKFHSEKLNVPAILEGSTRDFNPIDFSLIQEHMGNITEGICRGFGANRKIEWEEGYPVTVNTPKETENVFRASKSVGIESEVIDHVMFSEDFSYYLQHVPGNLFFIGGLNGPHNQPNHSPKFDFNDALIPICIKMWMRLIEDRLGLKLYS